jgi:hypothetical protein
MNALVEGVLSKLKIEKVYLVFVGAEIDKYTCDPHEIYQFFISMEEAEAYITELKFRTIFGSYHTLSELKLNEFYDFCTIHNTFAKKCKYLGELTKKLTKHEKDVIIERFYPDLLQNYKVRPYSVSVMSLR